MVAQVECAILLRGRKKDCDKIRKEMEFIKKDICKKKKSLQNDLFRLLSLRYEA